MAASSQRWCSANGSTARVIVHFLVLSSCIMIASGAHPEPVKKEDVTVEQCVEKYKFYQKSIVDNIEDDVKDFTEAIDSGKHMDELPYPAESCKKLIDALITLGNEMASDHEMKTCDKLYVSDKVVGDTIDELAEDDATSTSTSKALSVCFKRGPAKITPSWCVELFFFTKLPLYDEIRADLRDFASAIKNDNDARPEYPRSSCAMLSWANLMSERRLSKDYPDYGKCIELRNRGQAEREEFEELENHNELYVTLRDSLDACEKHLPGADAELPPID